MNKHKQTLKELSNISQRMTSLEIRLEQSLLYQHKLLEEIIELRNMLPNILAATFTATNESKNEKEKNTKNIKKEKKNKK